MMCRIDSHQHFWKRSRGDYDWLRPNLGPIYADFGPSDLQPLLTQSGVSKTVLVQAAATIAETHYMLSLADEYDFIAGVVGWVDMESPDAAEQIVALSTHPKFKGIRPMAQDIGDPKWLSKATLAPAFETLVAHGLRFDALVKSCHLDALLTVLRRHPDLRVVIDHAAKPDIETGNTEQWTAKMAEIGSETDAYCKVSGLVTEAGACPNHKSLAPYFEHLYQCFGADRLMWGSDWPVVKLSMEYGDWYSLTMELLATTPLDEQRKILGTTAATFYDI